MFVGGADDGRERWTSELGAVVRGAQVTVLAGERELLRLTRAGGRAGVRLVVGDRSVDVSRSPATVVTALSDAARASRRDPAAWCSVAATRLATVGASWGLLAPAPPAALGTVLLALTHPALRDAIDVGLDPQLDVPAWASLALTCADGPAVAAVLFPRATRPVAAALRDLLAAPARGVLAWWTLAVAVAASPKLEPDEVAMLLRHRAGGAALPAPTVDEVRRLRAFFAVFDRAATRRLAEQALTSAHGLDLLRASAAGNAELARCPTSDRPDDLVSVARFTVSLTRAVVRVPPPPQTPPTPARPRWSVAADPPAARGARSQPARTTDLRAALDGLVAGAVTLEVPRTPADLRLWSRVLENCLDTFVDPVRDGRSVVAAARRDGRLEAALEIDPARYRLRQFVGHRNRMPAREIVDPVLGALRRLGVRVD